MAAARCPSQSCATAVPASTGPNPGPCCLPPPIYPTPVPTYTPYPTPTPYVRTNDYFVGDPVYSTGTLRVRFRVTEITGAAHRRARPQWQPAEHLRLARRGEKRRAGVEYTLFPAAQMYVSEIVTPWRRDAERRVGRQPRSSRGGGHPARLRSGRLAAGADADVHAGCLRPGRDGLPPVSYAMDATAREGGPTQVPGRNIVSWLNAVNTDCQGEIQEPR